MFVKPNPDRKVGKQSLKVYDPVHRDYLPETGRKVADNAYWMRRLQVQDVVLIDEPTEPKAKAGNKSGGRKASTKKDVEETTTEENKE